TGTFPNQFVNTPDMAFRADGTLFAWTESSDKLMTINKTTGQATVFGINQNDFAGTLAFGRNGVLYHTDGISVGTLNQATGAFTATAPVTVNGAPANGSTTFFHPNAADFLPGTDTMYVSSNDDFCNIIQGRTAPSHLAILNQFTGAMVYVGSTVPGLDAIAFAPAPLNKNTTFTGRANSPVLTKSFGAASIAPGASTTLTFTLKNSDAMLGLAGIAFTDTLPAGLTVATPNGLATTCALDNFNTKAPVSAAGSIISTSAILLGPGASCTLTVNVTGVLSGVWANVTSAISVDAPAAPGAPAYATIIVTGAPPASGPGSMPYAYVLCAKLGLAPRRGQVTGPAPQGVLDFLLRDELQQHGLTRLRLL